MYWFLGSCENLAKVPPGSTIGLVVSDLPHRDCAALASNGELSIADGGLARYKTEYIDAYRTELLEYPNVNVVLVIEPDSLPNLVTNIGVAKCAGAAGVYKEATQYALRQLNLPNVAMYMDAGHGGWLGWDANLLPGTQIFIDTYKAAGSPSRVRALAINVANYNSVNGPAEFPSDLCSIDGFPAHFTQGLRAEWGDWCNVLGASFGTRPTTTTGSDLIDAFVWIKPGGESDGTSDTSSARYDSHCGASDAFFETPVKNANPAL
ncbi:cellulase [Choiromyces venosus 120613-1]|uniref:Glucanase n=1 Tax=Choiromyces venosus 120613-1 TaxID=1336337 RepID=A0A3N4IW26_9PEZI|nr:cellulase [Choiromyces venosus 120613-1]